jgi:hypothetical protein
MCWSLGKLLLRVLLAELDAAGERLRLVRG